MRLACIAISVALMSGCLRSNAQVQSNVNRVTVPMSVEGNVPIVTLTFKRPDGSSRLARFVFDSGGGAVILDEQLAADLGLRPHGDTIWDQGKSYRAVDVPAAFVGGMPVVLRNTKAFVHVGASSFTNSVKVEGLLPGKALELYQIVLDYPKQQLSIGDPGSISHRGEKLLCPYIASSGHPRVDVEFGSETYGFLLDTGTQLTLIRDDMIRRLSEEHVDWSSSTGAVGAANVNGASDDALLVRIPTIHLGSLTVSHVAAVSRPNEVYSATAYETPAPIIGALGGNVLSRFRVEIDYPDQLLFLEPSGVEQTNDFDTVGLVLDTNSAGQLVVRAVSSSASTMTHQNILPGDIIMQITGFEPAPYTLAEASRGLSGEVGERKNLAILRQGKLLSVTVDVSRIL